MSEPRPGLDEVERLLDDCDRVPLFLEFIGDCLTPVSAMLRLGTEGRCFLLESVEGGERLGRWSILGRDPVSELIGSDADPSDSSVAPEELATLVAMVQAREVSRDAAREVLTRMVAQPSLR